MKSSGALMRVGELWRYPVKSMRGELLEAAEVQAGGIAGDRVVHVKDERGRLVTSRARPRLLELTARLAPTGQPLVNDHPWDDAEVAQLVGVAAGDGARLVRYDGPERFDILPLLVATDGAITAFGHDGRRLRPNIVIHGVPGLSEREWEGRQLRIGETVIGLHSLRERCIMTTFDPDTVEQDVDVLRGIRARFDGKIALNAYVVHAGTVRTCEPVELLPKA
jgi:uncharacterized protein YcbX